MLLYPFPTPRIRFLATETTRAVAADAHLIEGLLDTRELPTLVVANNSLGGGGVVYSRS